MQAILTRMEELEEQLQADRRQLHSRPELGLELPETVAYVMNRLTQMGYSPRRCGPGGVTATVGQGDKVILLRADMDALPMEEKSGLSFSSEISGRAHCCGHDIHTAMLLNAAQVLKEQESELKGVVKLMFQPGEEVFAGAQSMIDDGLMTDPKPDAAFGLHIMSQMPAGHLCYCPKGTMASVNGFRITVTGKGTHGAMPEAGVDPVLAAAHILIALQEVQTREISALAPSIMTCGKFNGGTQNNIIPPSAMLEGTIRTFDAAVREHVVKRMHEVAEGVAAAFRAHVEIESLSDVPVCYNDPQQLEEMLGYIAELNDPQLVPTLIDPLAGSDDFALVAAQVPTTYLFLGGYVDKEGHVEAQHNPTVLFDEDTFAHGAAAYVAAAMGWLNR